MKLRCSLVLRELNSLASSEALPESVVQHIEECEECRREASAYAKLGNLLRECGVDEPETELTWDKLRSALSERPCKAHAPRTTFTPAYAWAAVFIVVVLAASVFCFNRRPDINHVPDPNRQAAVQRDEPVKQVPPAGPRTTDKTAKKQEQLVPEHSANHQIVAASQNEDPAHRTVPSAHKRGLHKRVPTQIKDKHNPAPRLANIPKNETSPAAPTDVAKENTPDASTEDIEIAVVGAEEHVIDVVGVGGEDTNGHEYVIQQVGYSPDQTYTKL